MPINYALYRYPLSNDPDVFQAKTQPVGTADLDEVIDRMTAVGSTVNRPDAISALDTFFTAVENLLLEGKNVTTPIANFKVSIKGTFHGYDAPYTPGQQHVEATVSPGKRLRATIRQKAQPRRHESNIPQPQVDSYRDANSGTRNQTLTAGGLGQLDGYRLKFNPDDPQQGIFIIATDGRETQVAVVGQNRPSQLIFMVPQGLPAGEYMVEVRTILPKTSDLRNGRLPHPLTIP